VKYGEAAFASHSTAKTWPEIRCKYFKTDQDYTRLRGFGFPARQDPSPVGCLVPRALS